MKEEELQQFVKDTKLYIYDNFNLNAMTDAELEEAVEALVNQQLQGLYVPIEQWALIVKQVYSAIRGFGLLDAIMADDDITEVMINGPEDIFIEKKGCLQKLDQSFESESRLEDIVQKIVGLAGREVYQANPIVDTRLPDGSRVNVVLPPIARNGATVTIRKFSKTPMTIEQLIKFGSITQDIANVLEKLIRAKYNIFICGGTGSGIRDSFPECIIELHSKGRKGYHD